MSATAPSAPVFRVNIGEAIRFFLRDPQWKSKVALGLVFNLLSFTIVGWLLVQGYMYTLAERVAQVEPMALPVWADYRLLLRKGWRAFLVTFVYALPIIIPLLLSLGCMLWGLWQFGGPGFLQNPGGLSSRHINIGAMIAAFGLAIVFILIAIPLSFVIAFLQPAALIQLIFHGQIRAAWQFSGVTAFIRRNLGQYALVILLNFGLTSLLSGFSVSYRASFDHFRSGAFLSDPVFWVISALLVVLTLVRLVTTFFVQLGFFHLLGQFCWHERTLAEGQ